MPVTCIVQGCSSRKGKGDHQRISFHTLPSNQFQRERWISILNDWVGIRLDNRIKGEYGSVCGLHFTPESFKPGTTKLEKNATPSVFAFNFKIDLPAPATKKARCNETATEGKIEGKRLPPLSHPILADSASNGDDYF